MPTFTLMVCPHDTVRNTTGWYRLLGYLSNHGAVDLHFELALDFSDFHARLARADLVFANPSDSLHLLAQGFLPLVRPANHYDEAVLVSSADAHAAGLDSLHNAAVAGVVHAAPTQLALYDLRRRSIAPAQLVPYDSWLAVVRGVWNGETPFGIVYRDAYDELSPQSRAMVHVIASTDVRQLFHLLCASPQLLAAAPQLPATLIGMIDDAVGRDILGELGFEQWQPVSAADLQAMQAILNN